MQTQRRPRRSGRKSEVLAVRVSPRTRYQAELLAQLHQMSLPEVVERALDLLAARPEVQGGATLHTTIEAGWDPVNRLGDSISIDLVEETWDEEEWCRRLKLAAVHPVALPPQERMFWQEILNDACATGNSDVPDDIEFDEESETGLSADELIFGRPAVRLPKLDRAATKAKWLRFKGQDGTKSARA